MTEEGRVTLDLHWRFVQSQYSVEFEPAHLWSRLEPFSLGGKVISCLKFDDLFLYLCIHGSKHCWERLGWICDISEMVRAWPQPDWNSLLRRAEALKIERVILLAFKLARDLLDAPLAQSLATRIDKDPAIEKLSRLVLKKLFSQKIQSNKVLAKTYFQLKSRTHLQDKLPYLMYSFHMAVAPNEHDLKFLPLPDPDMLILDEPTSSLDSLTEHSIFQALPQYVRGKTLFIIAHRLSTVQGADRILLSNHRIVAFGPPERVLQTENLLQAYGGRLRSASGENILSVDDCCDEGDHGHTH